MKLLVTGGAGFIGSAVIRQVIRETDWQVANLDKLTYAATPEAIEDCAENPRYQLIQGDITDRVKIDEILDDFAPDAVMHLAAESHVDRSIDGPKPFIDTNIIGTYTLLEALRARGDKGRDIRFHHVSTDEVYGSLSNDDPAFSETTPYQPNSPYSASKAASDHLVRAWTETFGQNTVTTNCSNNYGPWQFPEKLIPVMLIAALEGRDMPVYGQGLNIRDWLFVEDHARALRLVLEKGATGRTYNIGGNAERRNIDLVHMLCQLMDERMPDGAPHDRQIKYVTDRPGHDMRYAIDATRIQDELGWEPQATIESGLAETVDWYLANRDWWEAIRAGRHDPAKRLGTGTGG